MSLTHHQEAGFSLLEVLVATMILALTFGAVYPIFGNAPQRLVDANENAIAFRLASSVMEREVLQDDWARLPLQGEQGNWSWSLVGAQPDGEPEAVNNYPLELTVSVWETATPEREVVMLQRVVWVRN